MTYSPIIKQPCGISDKNITISELPGEETLDKLDYIPIIGILPTSLLLVTCVGLRMNLHKTSLNMVLKIQVCGCLMVLENLLSLHLKNNDFNGPIFSIYRRCEGLFP